MQIHRFISYPLFAASDGSGSGVITPSRTFDNSSDVLDELGSSGDTGDSDDTGEETDQGNREIKEKDRTRRSRSDKTNEQTTEEEGSEESDIELEEGDESEKLDLKNDTEIETPPRIKQLEKDFPKIFEKHPYLKKMIFRDREYNQMFGGFDAAKESLEKAEQLDEFETSLLSGNSEPLLSRIKENDSKAFKKIVDNLMPTLAKLDRESYINVAGDIVNQVIERMTHEGDRLKNDQLKDAAVILNQFVFGRTDFEPRRIDRNESNEETARERQEFEQERLTSSIEEVSAKVSNVLRNTINSYIDPKDEMTQFEKKHAVNQALAFIDERIGSDRLFRSQLDKLWRSVTNEKFSTGSKDKVRVVILGKAKTLLKEAITNARTEALRGKTRKTSEDNNSDNSNRSRERRGPIETGRSTPSGSGKKPEMKKGETVLDFLSRD